MKYEVDLQSALVQLNEHASRQFVVLQVGAHVGFTANDPVHNLAVKYGWEGVLMEPVPELYKQLVANYRSRGTASKLSFENAALGETTGNAFFHTRRSADYSNAARLQGSGLRTQLGSLRRSFGSKGSRITVNTITLRDLLLKYNITYIDYLQIDAEGMDSVVLNQIPFHQLTPHVIQYEQKHLPPLEKKHSIGMLSTYNYTVLEGGAPDFDVTAFSKTAWNTLNMLKTRYL